MTWRNVSTLSNRRFTRFSITWYLYMVIVHQYLFRPSYTIHDRIKARNADRVNKVNVTRDTWHHVCKQFEVQRPWHVEVEFLSYISYKWEVFQSLIFSFVLSFFHTQGRQFLRLATRDLRDFSVFHGTSYCKPCSCARCSSTACLVCWVFDMFGIHAVTFYILTWAGVVVSSVFYVFIM